MYYCYRLLLLKSRYGKIDAKISYIGRRAELALYSQAFSAREYRNPQTLSRRLHSLVVKLHFNNLTAKEDAAFVIDQAQVSVSRKRRHSSSTIGELLPCKRTRLVLEDDTGGTSTAGPVFFSGNLDLLQHVCSYLTTIDILKWAATCAVGASQLPVFVTSIDVTMESILKLSPTHRSTFFQRFRNLESFSLLGQMQAQQCNIHQEQTLIARNVLVRSMLQTLRHANLTKLTAFSLNFCYCEGLTDHITRQVANVLVGPSSPFPSLHTLSLVGNCIADTSIRDLYDALSLPRSSSTRDSRLRILDLSLNFIGERGHVEIQALVSQMASHGFPLIVNLRNNLLTLFVRTQTYDIPCDPRQPAKWLLTKAKSIERSSQKHSPPEDELEVLYNRTTRQVINLEESIGSSISAMDVIDARSLLLTPDTSFTSAMFPWLRSYPGDLQLSSDSSDGLFFQQLYAFTLIGKRTPVSASQRKQKQDQDAFLSLLHTYVTGNYDQDNKSRLQTENTSGNERYSTQAGCKESQLTNSLGTLATSSKENYDMEAKRTTVLPSSVYIPEHDPNGFSDSGSDSSLEDFPSYPTRSSHTNESGALQRVSASLSSDQAPKISSSSNPHPQQAVDGIENVFDIVFKQQAIGMKLGADDTKQYAIVKECFEGSEAKRYPEIQTGVVILAVNGQEVGGLGLSRVLYRLREAPRPVVVRFGCMSTRQLQERRKNRSPW
ncbi:hypothetical protein PsorP6_011740 [Peronosclerospora sorghi]|uniref:Uncharacterized protein n=1 Tax=Peronosclerospora sorghi TaxID=230839 RepID=A0ACC0WK73_9STRA|nr:hypothetical protein PsorP6_011740 [Peronosclerospora sorghi]